MRNSFLEILSNNVEIPIIQRDYAQGRVDDKTNKIRKDFLTALFDFIKVKCSTSPEKELELDFIYGFNKVDKNVKPLSFIPIDGQQRLTTLWLLYWLVSVKENINTSDKEFLSNFKYETRHSTTEFCKQLVGFVPSFQHGNIVNEIKDQPWYFETWNYDPSITAMLVVLKDLEKRYLDLNNLSLWQVIGKTNSPFYFYQLEMEKVGLTDDLYIKMNSRGKALTDFEYFKASFTELITDIVNRERFENSIDQEWIDAIWHIVQESKDFDSDVDIASIVDSCFLNIFNFITSVFGFKMNVADEDGKYYQNTLASDGLLKQIYSDVANQISLFEILDAICDQNNQNKSFWKETFYYSKEKFSVEKTRLFFPHKEKKLINRCLFHYGSKSSPSLPEQILLYACLIHLKEKSSDFNSRLRILRNLAVNSENELRESVLSTAFLETENYIVNGNLDIFQTFNTGQVEAEKIKADFFLNNADYLEDLKSFEDSEIFRGSISLIPLDKDFGSRSKMFLKLFDEDELSSDFNAKSNLLLCFGDYSQLDSGRLYNLMSRSKPIVRRFLTTPAFNKDDFFSNTQPVFLQCLDYFCHNVNVLPSQKIKEKLSGYSSAPKDWIYYFLQYPSFRSYCERGYYWWSDDDMMPALKMRLRQFNGYHWDPFLHEIFVNGDNDRITLENYNNALLVKVGVKKILISGLSDGFLISSGMSKGVENTLFNRLKDERIINKDDMLKIKRDEDGNDLEDRIKKLYKFIHNCPNGF